MRWGWLERAACRGKWSVMDASPDDSQTTVAKAKAVCRYCPVNVPCLSWALEMPDREDPGGTVAGTTATERRRLRLRVRARRRANGDGPVPEDMRRCQTCGRVLELEEAFDRTGRGWWWTCKDCRAEERRVRADRLRREAEERYRGSRRAG